MVIVKVSSKIIEQWKEKVVLGECSASIDFNIAKLTRFCFVDFRHYDIY